MRSVLPIFHPECILPVTCVFIFGCKWHIEKSVLLFFCMLVMNRYSWYIYLFSVVCHTMTYILPSLSCFATWIKNLGCFDGIFLLFVQLHSFCIQEHGDLDFSPNCSACFFLLIFLQALPSLTTVLVSVDVFFLDEFAKLVQQAQHLWLNLWAVLWHQGQIAVGLAVPLDTFFSSSGDLHHFVLQIGYTVTILSLIGW